MINKNINVICKVEIIVGIANIGNVRVKRLARLYYKSLYFILRGRFV